MNLQKYPPHLPCLPSEHLFKKIKAYKAPESSHRYYELLEDYHSLLKHYNELLKSALRLLTAAKWSTMKEEVGPRLQQKVYNPTTP